MIAAAIVGLLVAIGTGSVISGVVSGIIFLAILIVEDKVRD